MPTAKPLMDCGGFTGPARAFHISPSLRDPANGYVHEHLIVCYTELGGPRIEVYGGTSAGAARVMQPLPGSCILQHAVTLEDACVWALMTAGGYEIVVPDPVVDDSPAEFDGPTTLEPLALDKAESEVAEVIRVYELAKELGITSAELLAKLAEYGSTITNASANVDHDTAQIMRGIYAEGE